MLCRYDAYVDWRWDAFAYHETVHPCHAACSLQVAAAPASTSAPAAPAKGSAVPAAAPADGKKAGSTKAEAARAIAADAAPAAAAAADKVGRMHLSFQPLAGLPNSGGKLHVC